MHRNDKQVVLKRALLTVAVSSAALMAPVAHAAGMGKITVLSALGEPLRAELDVTASREEMVSLSARVAPAEAFRQANVEYVGILSTVRFVLDKRPDGRPYFRMETARAVNDPFIDLLVELSWSSGRVVREYAFLLDPPELVKGEAAAPAVSVPAVQPSAEAAAQEPSTEPAPPAKPAREAPSAVQKPKAESEEALVEKSQGDTRLVKRGDTLGKIAAESPAEGVTLDQMLVALFNSNRDAFIGGNMNRLRAGKILNIPDAEQAAAVSAGEAHKIVVAQSADFNAYRNSLAASAAAQAPGEQPTQQSASGKIAPKVEEKAPAADRDKLQVSRSDAQGAGKGKFTEEDVVARDKALKEANSRIADLEKNLADLKKLAELKSQAAADAQKAAQAAKTAPSVPTAAQPQKAETPMPSAPTIAAAPPAAAVSATAVAPAAEDKPKPKPKKKFVPPPPPPEPSFVEDNALLVYGGGAALAAILGFLGFRTWKRKRDAEAGQGITVSDLAASSIFGAVANEASTAPAATTDFGHSTIEAVDTSKEGVDPIQEAEVYMAYGRDGQAEEILLDAKKKDPTNFAVYLKLLEIYAGRKTLPQFNEVVGELHKRTEGSGVEWDKAAALGRSLDPTNPLYGGTAPVSPEPQQQTMVMEAPPPVAEAETEATMVMEAPPAGEVAAPAPAEAEPAAALDFDLDLTLPAASEPAAEAAPAPAAEVSASDLDFDLGMDSTPAAEPSAPPSAVGLDINFDAAQAGNSIDFDLAVAATPEPPPAADAQAPTSEPPTVEPSTGSALDFDFDFDLGETAAKPAEPPSPALDLSSISLDLEEPAAPAASEESGDSPEVATKLELAQAYEEMGDREGARELLEEVLAEGSPVQQESARAKLAQLA